MGIGDYTLPDIAPVLAPVRANLDLKPPGVYARFFERFGSPINMLRLPGLEALMVADGVNPMRVVGEDRAMRVGILPPDPNDMVTTPTGNAAQTVLTILAQPAPGDRIFVGDNGAFGPNFVTVLSDAAPGAWQVLIGATLADTISNLVALMNNEAGQMSRFVNALIVNGAPVTDPRLNYLCYIPSTTATTVTFEATAAGTSGNALDCVVGLGGPNMSFPAANFTGGANGVGESPLQGGRTWTYRYFRKWDSAYSGVGNLISLQLGTPQAVDLSNMVDSEDPWVSHKQWLRSLVSGGLFYVGDDIPTGTDVDQDTLLDTQISGGNAIPYSDIEFRAYETGHVPNYRVIELHNGSVFGGGAFLMESYTNGTISVTTGSRDVAAVLPCIFQADMEGSLLRFADDGKQFLLVEVDEATQTGRLSIPYEGRSGTGAHTFVMEDGRDPDEFAWSEPNKYSQWPFKNSFRGVKSDDGKGITGLKSHWESLNIFTSNAIYRFSGTELGTYILRKVVEGVGAASHHSIVEAEGSLFFAAPGAFFGWDGGARPVSISKPPVDSPGQAMGIHATVSRINWIMGHLITGRFDPVGRTVTWLVPLDDDVLPRHRLVFDLQSRGWALDHAMSCYEKTILSRDGTDQTINGMHDGSAVQSNHGNADGIYGVRPVVTLVDFVDLTITASPAIPWEPDTMIGGTVWLKDNDGNLEGFLVTGNGADTINVSQYPDGFYASGDQIILGGIYWRNTTGEYSNGTVARVGRVADVDIGFNPQAEEGRMYFGIGSDLLGPPALPEFGEQYADMTDTTGHKRFRANAPGRWHQLDFQSILPGGDPDLIELAASYRSAAQNRSSR